MSWDTRFRASLSEGELGASSTFRELRAVEEGLLANTGLLSGKTVRWGTDNWATSKIVKWGSMKRNCHEVAVRIQEICRKFEIRLEMWWLSRDNKEIELCDG